MIFPSNRVRILVATTPVDFRKGHDGLAAMASGPTPEVFWTLGPDAAAAVPDRAQHPGSGKFPDAGVYIMRAGNDAGGDHVFIDCGPGARNGGGRA